MDFSFSNEATIELRKIKKTQPLLFKKIEKQLKLFRDNIKHPSLRTHKLKGNLSNTWSISIQGNFRIVYFIKDNEAIFFKFGSHGEVYRK